MKNTSLIIRRADLTKNFSIIPNAIAQSKTLSANAKSLIIHMLSMPDNWYYVKTRFWRETNLSRDVFNKAWNELTALGYIQSERIKEGNLLRGYHYIISDSPIFGVTEAQLVRDSVNRESVSNKRNRNKEINTNKIGTKEAEEANKLSSLPSTKDLFEIISLYPNLSSEEQIKIYHSQLQEV